MSAMQQPAPMQASYWMDGQLVERAAFYTVACDPRRSVVVEACAGAGKTWMLVSRIVRALLDGRQPQEILAITFTKKAAAEMRERLFEWLRGFAAMTHDGRVEELVQRGLSPGLAAQQAAALQGLYQRVLEGGRSVEIHTFHRWFSRLMRSAPMDMLAELGLPPEMNLLEDNAELLPDIWRRFMQVVSVDVALTDDYTSLVGELGRHATQGWLEAALGKRSEFEMADAAGVVDACLPAAAQWSSRWVAFERPAQALLHGELNAQLWRLARAWGSAKGSMALRAAAELEAALRQTDADIAFKDVWSALFTQKDAPRAKLPETEDWPLVADVLTELKAARDQQTAHELHARMTRLTRVLLHTYADIKRERGLADMDDLERGALHLLRDANLSGWVQERLDARVRQVLIDEFQDTSPLQWQALHAWLSGYAGAGGGASGREPPGVFIVGDPKQSIYRFRRAEPRVFAAAQTFVTQGLGGALLACDHTRRNAPAVLAALNGLFEQASAEGAFIGFRPHTTESAQGGAVRALPGVPRQRSAGTADDDGEERDGDTWRDSLNAPRHVAEEALRLLEGRQVAAAIAELLGQGLAAGEVFVLSRRREALRWVAQALRERHIAHVAPEDHVLLGAPEARDVVALLDALVSPQHDLSLAHALRSPLFGATDADLLALGGAARRGGWWAALLAADWAEHPALQRARELLPQWQAAAQHVPPHDWLDRIVAQGQWRERLAVAVPTAQRQVALAALDAVLAQALALDGGRYLTPYGFVRALKRQPLSFVAPQQADAVQLLTVHGAKGLEAKAVFIVDADSAPARADSHTLLIEWPVDAAHPTCCAFVKSETRPPPSLAAAMENERLMRAREELNGLYVAMTRAREQLVFSRLEPHRRGDSPTWWQRAEACAGLDEASSWRVAQDDTERAASPGRAPETIQLPAAPAFVPRERPADAPAAPDAASGSREARLGQAVHRVLEWLTVRPLAHRSPAVLADAAGRAAAEFGLGADDAAAVERLAARVLFSPALLEWLDPARLVWAGNEVELTDPLAPEVLRLDRLVARRAGAALEWWVLDYKLQHRPQDLPAYREQLTRYHRAVQALQPGETVRAAFITGSGELVELRPPDLDSEPPPGRLI